MTPPSKRTQLLTFGATLLLAISLAYHAGEFRYCKDLQFVHSDKPVVTKTDEVIIDPCTMWDFGMTPFVRLTFWSGLLLLIVAAASYGRDRRQTKRD